MPSTKVFDLNKSLQDAINDKFIKVRGVAATREVYLNGKLLKPSKSQRVRNHSPDGFNWGYGGSGPAQLALAILLEVMPKDKALRIYQDFKFKVVAGWPQGTDFEEEIELGKSH